MKTALVLGGGGARGLAHIGVLKTLEKNHFKPDLIVGCSMGAIIGAMYAYAPDAEKLQIRIEEVLKSEVYAELNIETLERHRNGVEKKDYIQQVARNAVKRVMLNVIATKKSIVKSDKVDRLIDALLPGERIENFKIPFACNSTDLLNGRAVLIHQGDVRTAVKASSAIPGYLPPQANHSQVLVDGAVSYALPVKFAKMLGADYIVAVEVPQEMPPQKDFTNVFDIILRANMITGAILSDELRKDADVLISPHVGGFSWYDFAKLEDLVNLGSEAAEMHLPQILRETSKRRKSLWRLWRNS